MTSGRKPLSAAVVLGILGSAGGILNFITFAIGFATFSSAELAANPLFTPGEQLILLGLCGSSVMGMVGAIFSIRYPGRGAAIMLMSACTGLLTLGLFIGSSFGFLYGADFGWWAVVLLFGGIFGLRTWMARQDENGMTVGKTGASQTL